MLAITAALALAAYLSPVYFIAWCSLVPFSLLRTPRTVRLGQLKYRRLHDEYDQKWGHLTADAIQSPLNVLHGAFVATRFTIMMLWLRVVLLFAEIYRSPFGCIRCVPDNWRQVVFAIDIAYAPEIITGQHGAAKPSDTARIQRLARAAITLTRRGTIPVKLMVVTLAPPFFVLAYLPSLLFRWSVKSTSLVWLGLLWGAVFTPINGTRIAELKTYNATLSYCKLAAATPMRMLAAMFSSSVLFLIVAKILGVTLSVPPKVFGSEQVADLLNNLVVPGYVPPWQWASALVCISTLVALFTASTFVKRHNASVPSNHRLASKVLGICELVAWGLRGYVILCTLYIVWSSLSRLHLPPLGNRIIPWIDTE